MNFMKKTTFILRIVLTFLSLFLVVFIFSNSVKNADSSSISSGRVTDLLNGICSALNISFRFTQDIVRTLAHFCEFALLGVLFLLTFISYLSITVKTLIISTVSFCFVALADECIQLFADGRTFQVLDLIIDISGGLVGTVSILLIVLIIQCHTSKVLEKG